MIFADRLAVVAISLFIVYLFSVLAVILPFRLLDPLWQISAIKVATEAGSIPLIGLALLHLAAYICPDNIPVQHRQNGLARLAILASIGFLLFVPLQGYAVIKSYRIANEVSSQQQGTATQRADTVRKAIEQASSFDDLKKRLLELQRSNILRTLDIERIPSIPLPLLKQQLLAQVNQAEGQFKAAVGPLDAAAVDRITRDSLRVMVSSLAFSIAFAALAQRRNSRVPFLMELPTLPGRLIGSLQPRRARPGQAGTGLDFLKSPTKREEEFFESLAPPEDEHPRTR
ncbi:hypothetical protein [Cyanobium gracile]|uniref:hypothetical protein n=1 Tax=Cyanobium gracile TaxID=59930 RepID=UPI0012EAC86A|nr:hypothetical protein [Cyanobium gracile]